MLLENLKESRLAQSMSSDLPKDADLVERAVDIKHGMMATILVILMYIAPGM